MTRKDPNLLYIQGEIQDKPEPTLRKGEKGSFLYFKIESVKESDDGKYTKKTWPLVKMFGKSAEWAAKQINQGTGNMVRVIGELASAKNQKTGHYECVIESRNIEMIGDADEQTVADGAQEDIPF